MRIPLLMLLLCCAMPVAAQQLKPWNGGATPVLELRDVEGRLHRLADYRGKVVLVNFWATWCEPCREEMPSMNRLRASLSGQPFEVLAVNLAEPETRIRRFVEQLPLQFAVLMDRDSAVARAWRARVLPISFVVGPDGRIRYSVVGELDWNEERVRKLIIALMPPASTAGSRAVLTTQPRAALSASSR